MIKKHRNYLLKDATRLHAHVHVIPTGLLEIEIVEKRQYHAAEFEHLHFERKGKITELVGKDTLCGKPIKWQVPLKNEDANELEQLIEQASEELEILMRDL